MPAKCHMSPVSLDYAWTDLVSVCRVLLFPYFGNIHKNLPLPPVSYPCSVKEQSSLSLSCLSSFRNFTFTCLLPKICPQNAFPNHPCYAGLSTSRWGLDISRNYKSTPHYINWFLLRKWKLWRMDSVVLYPTVFPAQTSPSAVGKPTCLCSCGCAHSGHAWYTPTVLSLQIALGPCIMNLG